MNGLSFTIGPGSASHQQQQQHREQEAARTGGQGGADGMSGGQRDGRDRRFGGGGDDGVRGYQQQQQQGPHVPSQYQPFQSFAPPSQSLHAISHPYQGYNPHTSLRPSPSPSTLSQQQHQNYAAQHQQYSSSPNPPDATLPHRYDFAHPANQQPASSAQPHQQQQIPSFVPPPFNHGGYPRRRESMPEIMGSASPELYMRVGPSAGIQGQTSPFDGMSRMRGFGYPPPPRDEMMPTGAMGGGAGGPSGPSFGSWQQLMPGMSQGDGGQASTSLAATVDPTATIPELGQRSRRSTLGSRSTDEDYPGTRPGTGTTAGTDTGTSRQLSDEPMVAWDDLPPASRPDSSAGGLLKGKGKAGKDDGDDAMDVDGGDGGEEKMDHRKRKRNRTIRSCVPCHNHKRKCDRKRPCGRCTALGLTGTCVYEIDEARDMNDPDVAEHVRLKRRIAELEQVVRELRQKAPSRNAMTNVPPPPVPQPSGPPPIPLSSAAPVPASTSSDDADNNGKKRRVIVDRFAHFKLDEAKAAENDAGPYYSDRPPEAVKVKAEWAPDKASDALEEEARKGEEVGSSAKGSTDVSSDKDKEDYRAEPYSTHLLPGEEMVYDSTGRQVFLGASAGKSMLRRLRELASTKKDGELLAVPENVAFSGVFPNLRKTFPFTTIWSHENFCAEIIGLLPNLEQSELLWDAWEENYQPYFSPFHLPTLKSEHTKFFQQSAAEKMSIPLSSLAVFLMICALGCLKRATSAEIFGHPEREVAVQAKNTGTELKSPKDLTSSRLQSELYLSAAYQALRLCSFMANPTVHTLQCQVLIEVYLLASERAADAWAIGGNMIKQAIALGLHKDPLSLDPNISMRDAEVKRRLWWSIAGFDCMLCVFFGRPCGISYYTTNLPQDRPDENLSDAPGSAQQLLPPSNVLVNETTDQTFHAAYYQLTIPSFELLERIFHVDRRISRSAIYGWFSPPPENSSLPDESPQHTYQDAIRLGQDISQWYAHLPRGMRFDADDTPEYMLGHLTKSRVNQALGLCIKSWTLVLVLHRPYLRVDPAAYPESTESCIQAAHMILRAYRAMSSTKSTLAWILWTMSYRAFQAGAVCAFLALRQPGTEVAAKCLEDLRGAIQIFEDRVQSWNSTHPVQGDLCEGLVQLEKLVTASTRQRQSPTSSHKSLFQRNSPAMGAHGGGNGMEQTLFGLSPAMHGQFDQSGTPLSQIRAFPSSLPSTAVDDNLSNIYAGNIPGGGGDNGGGARPDSMQAAFGTGGMPQSAESLSGTFGGDFNGPGPLALPGFWASMFGIKMDKDKDSSPPEQGSWS
ncbi:hypothetical protein IAT38_002929 [Cryptococcus sp. DSM 104549]